jgi:ankyrin repeat protein
MKPILIPILLLALVREGVVSCSTLPGFYLQEMQSDQIVKNDLSSLLRDASAKGDVDKVKALLKAGASLTDRDKDDRTALMLAVAGNHREVAGLLLAAGANVNEEASDKGTPLGFALCCAGTDLFKDILAAGANLNVRYGRGRTPLMVAAADGDNEKIKMLLNAGVIAYDVDDDGATALMYAAEANGNAETIHLLLAAGIDINAKNLEGRTALSYARRNYVVPNRGSMMKLIKKYGGTE